MPVNGSTHSKEDFSEANTRHKNYKVRSVRAGIPSVLVFVLLLGEAQALSQSGGGRPVTHHYEANPDERHYFPDGVFDNYAPSVRTFAKYLIALGEKPLLQLSGSGYSKVVRLTVELRPYNAPIVVRLGIRASGSGQVIVKAGRDGGHPGLLTVHRTIEASPSDVAHFLVLLSESNFWSLPSVEPFDPRTPPPLGDESWILEASDGDKYHMVYRGRSEAGSLGIPYDFLLTKLAAIDPKSLPVGPKAQTP